MLSIHFAYYWVKLSKNKIRLKKTSIELGRIKMSKDREYVYTTICLIERIAIIWESSLCVLTENVTENNSTLLANTD